MNDDLDRFIAVNEAAHRLDIAPDTAYRWIRDGKFPVPTITIGGRRKVHLRTLVDFMAGGGQLEVAS